MKKMFGSEATKYKFLYYFFGGNIYGTLNITVCQLIIINQLTCPLKNNGCL